MGLGWAGSAAIGGLLLSGVGFNDLFYLTSMVAACAAVLTWGYQRATMLKLPSLEDVDSASTGQPTMDRQGPVERGVPWLFRIAMLQVDCASCQTRNDIPTARCPAASRAHRLGQGCTDAPWPRPTA
jgi:hypothetical protein